MKPLCICCAILIIFAPHFHRNKNKNRGKSIRKRIQASFRRKSARDKQKKLDQQKQFQCEMDMPENSVKTNGEYVSCASSSEIDLPVNETSNPNGRVRKTSKFLTVDEGLRHLSICEAGENEDNCDAGENEDNCDD